MSSEGSESTDINSEQAQQESASILNVLRALTPAEIRRKQKVATVPPHATCGSKSKQSRSNPSPELVTPV